ncbi:unnamed protein product, partial [Ectocarpus sp. 13 AM-2016]
MAVCVLSIVNVERSKGKPGISCERTPYSWCRVPRTTSSRDHAHSKPGKVGAHGCRETPSAVSCRNHRPQHHTL